MNTRPGPDSTRSRRESRERAVELAYEAEVRQVTVDDLIAGQTLPLDSFVVDLLRSAETHRAKAEEMIEATSTSWSLSRMAVLDVVVMRLAVAELLDHDTPTGVVLAEAVELAGRYSTEESSRFVNGLLSAIADEVRPSAS